MSRGHWRIGFAFIALLSVEPYQQWAYGKEGAAQQQGDEKPELNDRSLTALQDSIERIAASAESIEAQDNSPDEKQHASRDLDAQEGMWFWAKVAAIAATIAALLTAVGLIMLWRTLHWTRDAALHANTMADEAEKATQAALTAANATVDANEINKISAERRDRAYLSVTPLGVRSLVGNSNCIGYVLLKNVGATPAYNVSLKVMAEIVLEKERKDFLYPPDPKEVARTIQPNSEMSQGSMKPFLPFREVDSADRYIFVWGVAYYDDAFGKRRFTKFCHRYHTASRNQDNIFTIRRNIKPHREALTIIEAEKARHHTRGNDAD